MARLRTPARLIQAYPPAAPIGPGTAYPIEFGNLESLATRKRLDVAAAMFFRVKRWNFQLTASLTHTFTRTYPGPPDETETFSFSASISENVGIDADPIPTSEKEFAHNASAGFILQAAMLRATWATVATLAGSWNASRSDTTIIPNTDSGTFDVKLSADWSLGLHLDRESADAGCMGFTAGVNAYPPPATDPNGIAPEVDHPDHQFTIIAHEVPGATTLVGAITVRVPDWIGGTGHNELSVPLYKIYTSSEDSETHTLSCDVVMTPLECFPYGYNPGNPTAQTTLNRVWNDDGTAAQPPLPARLAAP